jgi:hypothetical protein
VRILLRILGVAGAVHVAVVIAIEAGPVALGTADPLGV